MATCSTCGSSVDDGSRFCSYCGSLSQQSKPLSYDGSIALGIALLVFAVIWELVSLAPPPTSTQTVTPEPPDDAAVLITNCGQPDAGSVFRIEPLKGEKERKMDCPDHELLEKIPIRRRAEARKLVPEEHTEEFQKLLIAESQALEDLKDHDAKHGCQD